MKIFPALQYMNSLTKIVLLCVATVLVPIAAPAAALVNYGSAGQFLFLDLDVTPGNDGVLGNATFHGNVGWSATNGKKLSISSSATVNGDLIRPNGSILDNSGTLNGTDFNGQDMTWYISDASQASSQFQSLVAEATMPTVSGGTINRIDADTVIDIGALNLSSTTLTINGNPGDFFYLRVQNSFNLSSSSVTITGTDPSRVFFYYSGTADMSVSGGNLDGHLFAPNAKVNMSSVNLFTGTVVSGNGFQFSGATSTANVTYVTPIPEPSTWALIGGGSLLSLVPNLRRRRQVS